MNNQHTYKQADTTLHNFNNPLCFHRLKKGEQGGTGARVRKGVDQTSVTRSGASKPIFYNNVGQL